MTTNNLSELKISVVIPLYNKYQHVIRTIDSVLAQHEEAYEIIVVDDGSTDGGPNLVERERGDKVRLIRQLNAGVSAARNTGIQAARGNMVAFIDADDSWEPHFLQEIWKLAQVHPEADCFGSSYQFITGDEEYVDPKIRFPHGKPEAGLLENYFEVSAQGDLPFMMSSFCVRLAAFDKIGLFPEGEPMGEDQDFFARAALRTKIAYSPSVLAFYHLDTSNRACERLVPKQECPFSKRVLEMAHTQVEQKSLREAMIDYTAAHLLHIVSLNVKAGRFDLARKLLSDARCKRHKMRYLWWKLRIFITNSLLLVRGPATY